MSSPVLLAGKPLPLNELSPADFEGFVHGALHVLAPRHGFTLGQLSGAAGDGGFDCDGQRIPDGRLICIQAKRFSTDALSIPHVAFELAKVALTSCLKGAAPKEHYFITSGKVRNVLNEALREERRGKLVAEAIKIGLGDDRLNVVRDEMHVQRRDVQETITNYIEQLDRIPVWSGDAFDRQLGLVWSQLTGLIQRYFTVERVLVEHPRPDWGEETYLQSLRHEQGRRLRATPAELPANVRLLSAADPRTTSRSVQGTRGTEPSKPPDVDAVDTCLQVEDGDVLLLLGAGGAGKSTTLRMALHQAAVHRQTDSEAPLPIYVPLGSFRNSLRILIELELGVRAGNWESIPGRVLLLCDGLNELGPSDQAAVIFELSTLLRRRRIAVILSLRATGLPAPIVFPPGTRALQLRPLTFRDIRDLAAEFLEPAVALSFVTEIRKRVTYSGVNYFTLPFGVASLLHFYETQRRLPGSVSELVEDLLRRRYDTNEEILVRRPDSVRMPRSTLKGLARQLAAEMYLHRRRTAVTREEFEDLVRVSIGSIRISGVFDAEGLRDREALSGLLAYEMIFHDRLDAFRFEHDIVAGHLASERLAAEWQSYLALLTERSLDEAWLLAARHVSADSVDAFFTKLCETDVILAACAVLESGRDVRLVESILLTKVRTPTSSLVTRWEVFTALAILATPTITAELRKIAAQSESDEQQRALRALCMAGDRETLAQIIPEVDQMMSLPGVRSSGGNVSNWQSAPPAVALALARERVDHCPEGLIGGSLLTIGGFGDVADIPRLMKVIGSTDKLAMAVRAYFAAAQFDETIARQAFMEVLESASPSVRIQALAMIGAVPDDAEWLIDFILALSDEDAYTGMEGVRLLANVKLPDRLESKVRAAYDTSDATVRECLWSIARDHQYVSFEPLAIQAFGSPDSSEAGYAANFATNHSWSSDELRDRFISMVKVAVENDWFAYDWQGWRTLAFLLSAGERELVGRVLERRMRKLIAVAQKQAGGELEGGATSYRAGMDSLLLGAGEVADLIPADVVLEVLRLSKPYSREANASLQRMLARLDPQSVDEALERIVDAVDRLDATCLVAPLGSTAVRERVIGEGFALFLDDTAMLGRMVEVVGYLWSDSLLRRIVSALVSACGTSTNGVREHQLAKLAKLVSKTQGETIIAPVLPTLPVEEGGIRQTLQLWYEISQRIKRIV